MTDLVKLIAVCEKAAQEPEKMVLLDPAAVLPIAQGAASALESLTAENAALKAENTVLKDVVLNPDPDAEPDNIRLHREKCDALDRAIAAESRAATLLKQRNEAFERAAAVADGFAKDNAANAREMIAGETIAAGIRNLSKES